MIYTINIYTSTHTIAGSAVDAILERRKRLQNDIEDSDSSDDEDWL